MSLLPPEHELRAKIERRDARIAELDAERDRLREACKYPRYGDTAKLMEEAADLLDKQVKEGWSSFLTPHLRRAADRIRQALQPKEQS